MTAQAQTFLYTTNADGTLTVTGGYFGSGSVTIPSTIYGRSVTRIGTNAFYANTNLTGVTIPRQ